MTTVIFLQWSFLLRILLHWPFSELMLPPYTGCSLVHAGVPMQAAGMWGGVVKAPQAGGRLSVVLMAPYAAAGNILNYTHIQMSLITEAKACLSRQAGLLCPSVLSG